MKHEIKQPLIKWYNHIVVFLKAPCHKGSYHHLSYCNIAVHVLTGTLANRRYMRCMRCRLIFFDIQSTAYLQENSSSISTGFCTEWSWGKTVAETNISCISGKYCFVHLVPLSCWRFQVKHFISDILCTKVVSVNSWPILLPWVTGLLPWVLYTDCDDATVIHRGLLHRLPPPPPAAL